MPLTDRQRTSLFAILRRAGWTDRDQNLFAPSGDVWLDIARPWEGDLDDFLARMSARLKRTRGSLGVTSLDDVATLVQALQTLVDFSPLQRTIAGCLIGGAIGDALGRSSEGLPPCPRPEQPDIWRLTDDTILTLATCDAIATRSVSPQAVADTFVLWHRERRFGGLGASTSKAISDLASGAHWALSGRRGEHAAGNGAAMRIAPLAFFAEPAEDDGRRLIRDICRITHHNDEAYVGALAIVVGIRLAVYHGVYLNNDWLAAVAESLPDTQVRDRLAQLVHDSASVADIASRFGASGHVVESVPLALCAAARIHQHSFREVMLEIVAAGGDTDTNASMFGQIAGAALGIDGLPHDWVDRVPDVDWIAYILSKQLALKANQPG